MYAYLQQVPVKRQYDVAYPYGVGGDNPLDQLASGYNFDSWVTSAIIGYFLNRSVFCHFSATHKHDSINALNFINTVRVRTTFLKCCS